jgi:hypothetical protein
MKLATLFLVTMFSLVSSLDAETIHFRSSIERVSLLELYTSEGCSSCPPADAWLNKLKGDPGLWKNYVPVAFHVDYWNYLGWHDPWSGPEFSQRQRDYAAEWHTEDIYTPEFVLNGAEWRNWFGLRATPGSTGQKVGVLEISSTNNALWNVTFASVAEADGKFEVHAALLAGGLSSEVKAGENSGHILRHEFAVVELVQIGLTTSNGVVRGKFLLPFTRHTAEKNLAVAVWITRAGEIVPLQATGGWFKAGQAVE